MLKYRHYKTNFPGKKNVIHNVISSFIFFVYCLVCKNQND